MDDIQTTLEERFEKAVTFPTAVAIEAGTWAGKVQEALPVLRWLLRGIVPDDLLDHVPAPQRPMGALAPILTPIPNGLVGLTTEEALRTAEGFGFKTCIRTEDGISGRFTADYRKDRVNFEITQGRVTKASIG